MAINRERLEQRREEIRQQLEQAKANFHALQGALVDLNFLLEEDSKEDKQESKKQ